MLTKLHPEGLCRSRIKDFELAALVDLLGFIARQLTNPIGCIVIFMK